MNERIKRFALELETVRSRVLEEFAADFKFSIKSVDEYVKEVESDSARTDDEKEFAKKLTEEGALFKPARFGGLARYRGVRYSRLPRFL